jgi:hypothetical protein
MAIQETPPRHGSGARAEARPQRARQREAQEHGRSADIYEPHAVLLGRFGAHRSTRTERRHAEDERSTAETARQAMITDSAGNSQR